MALAWALVGALVSIPYLVAALEPPPGRTFAGTFHWIDDLYNYASFVQQAEDGQVLFRNKLLLEDHDGSLVNLEWSLVGWVSRACGRRPFLAYRLFALAALAGLLAAADRALRRAGLPASHRFPALILVALGGGLGGILFDFTPRAVFRSADLYVGFYPFLEALANPHWLAATWLLLESLLAFGGPTSRRGTLRAIALGTALGLVRPYDLALLVAAQLAAVAMTAHPHEWLRRALPLAGLLPVVLYNYRVFYASATFGTFAVTAFASPPSSDLLWALAPAAIVAIAGIRGPDASESGRLVRAQLWAWAGIAVLLVWLQPVTFALQFAVGAGLPLLVLAALGLARLGPAAFAVAALAFSSSAVVATRIVLRSDPHWHVPAERMAAARMLRPACRPGDLAFAPADIGLYVLGLTSCKPFTSHPWEPDHAERQAIAAAFYATLTPAARSAVLDRLRARHLLLPGDPGPAPEGWLGAGTPFRQVARTGGGDRTISLYSR